MDLIPLWISLKTAVVSTMITFVLGLSAAGFVMKIKKGKAVFDSIFSIPLVLPPTVVGFLLLQLFGKNSLIGKFLSLFGTSVVFSVTGAVIAAVVVAFPLMYRTARGALEQVNEEYIFAARTLGRGEFYIFYKIIMPVAWPGILSGVVLAFARGLGEFGATIMVAGNIPGKTQTMSVLIYTAVQAGNKELAYQWVIIISCISFILIWLMNVVIRYEWRKK